MVNTSVFRLSSKTYTIVLTGAATNALLITPTTNDQINYVHLLNVGANVCGVELSGTSTVKTPAVATTGLSGSYVLPALMNSPILIACPQGPFYIRAIGAGSTLYVTAAQAG
jgi:hypothetical protein